MITFKGKRLLIKQDNATDQTAGGIFIPQSLQSPKNIGEVIVVGDGADQSLLGKRVMFNLPAATTFNDGELKGKLIFTVDLIATLN